MGDENEHRGPVESVAWPEHLTARAVDGPRLFGYDVQEDLARHYRFSDVFLLSLTGELPDDARSRAFEIALAFASTMSVGRAPIHATVLARLCGCRPGSVLSIATMSLGEDAEACTKELSELLAAVGKSASDVVLPESLRATSDEERQSVARLRALVNDLVVVPLLASDPSLDVALVAVLRACGLETPFSLVAALVVGRLPSAIAEARLTKPTDFRSYPMNVPRFIYEAPEKE